MLDYISMNFLTDALTLHVKGINVANTTKQQHFEDVCCNIEVRVVTVIMHILVDCCNATHKHCEYHEKFHIHTSWGGCKVHSRMEISHRTKTTTKAAPTDYDSCVPRGLDIG
eukprot:3834089-Ditylum_brightwellii.AAC.1